MLIRFLGIYFDCPFYFREPIALTDIEHVMLNMESSFICPTTKGGGLPAKVESNVTYISRWIHELVSYGGNIVMELGGTCENPIYD